MANLPESSAFDAGVYQIETSDPVLGGVNGTTNKPLKNLANRTKYLKDHVDALESTRAPLASPALTGTPTAPTAAADTSTTQVATTAFVVGQAGAAAPAMAGTAAAGTSARYARQDHVHPTDTTRAPLASPALTGTPTAPTAAADTSTTQVATTAFVVGQAGAVAPAMNGAATAGTSARYARQDHVHPTDTTRAPLASPALTGTPTAPTAAGGTNTTQLATTEFVQAAVSPKLNTADIGNYAPTKTGGGASGTWGINVTGNAATASAIPWSGVTGKPGQIVAANGSIPAISDWNSYTGAGVYLVAGGNWGSSPNSPSAAYSYGTTLVTSDGGNAVSQLYIPHDGGLAYRAKWSAADWKAWRYVLDSGNYNSYAPTLTGGGASGTWGINITGRGFPKKSDGGDLNFNYSGQAGQPPWLWGTNDGGNAYVYNPANFNVYSSTRSARLTRRDGADDYSLQHHWTGARWRLQGYQGDTYHAGAEVAYADLAGAVADAGSSKAQSGYIKVPGSNLIIQWGRLAIGDTPQDYFGSISFSIAFPNQIFQVNVTSYSYAAGAFDISVGVTAHSLTGFNFTVQEWSNITQNTEVSYIAIGY